MHRLASTAAAIVALLAACALSACFGMPEEPDIAAYVNNEKIYENDVTEYIEGFRSKNQMYETDSGWMEFLTENSFTAESIRQYVLEETFIPKLLIRQECAKRSITLTDEVLQDVIAQERAFYEAKYGENSWESVLASYGYDEASWRENESDRLLEEQLKADVTKKVSITSAEVQAQANETAQNYNGKHSYYCVCGTEDKAKRLRASLSSYGDALTVKRFKAMTQNAQNGGWNSLAADRAKLSMDYINALDALGENELSKPLSTEEGFVVIWCDRTFAADSDSEYVSLKDVPKAILKQIEKDALENKTAREFSKWLMKKTKKAHVRVLPMPDDLPYNVNVARTEKQ